MYTKTISQPIALAVTILAVCSLWWTSTALANCGDIITQTDYGEGPVEEQTPIEDCTNPFNADTPAPFTYELTLAGQTVDESSVITVAEAEPVTGSFVINKGGNFVLEPLQLFRREGEDYRQVASTWNENFEIDLLVEGEYVAVLLYERLILQVEAEPLWKQWFQSWFMPATAHAFFEDYAEVVAISFTIEYEAPTPTGASSVLFLPGIMGSRLYEEGSECEADSAENERWFSRDECDQLRLRTNIAGNSVFNIYAKSGVNGIFDDAYFAVDIYDSFLTSLQEWEDEEAINEFAVFPYDWRLGLDTVVRSQLDSTTGRITASGGAVEEGYLYALIADLAEDSDNGKVTIVTHSNGGLVAKHFLDALDKNNDPLLDEIENLILVAVPQAGTPDSVIGILHGNELDHVMSQEISRQLVNTMSFAHHLLPGLQYFDVVETPVITFETGLATNVWRSTWGESITTRDGLHSFLDKDSGRVKPAVEDLATPEVVDNFLLNYARTAEIIQSNWTPPETLRVVQIAGTGLETPSTLEYFTDRTCINQTFFVCTEYRDKISYRVNMVADGDGTVVEPSALALVGDTERLWFNLLAFNNDGFLGMSNKNRVHRDIFEAPEIREVVIDMITNAEIVSYEYLTTERPGLDSDTPRLVFQLHSPLDLSLSSATGIISSSSETMRGGIYRRYGDLQYISVPRTNETVTLFLQGEEPGSFTLEVEEKNGDSLISRQTYSGIPSATSTQGELVIESDSEISDLTLAVDYDGNGEVDVQYTTGGVVLEDVSYDDLIESIKSLSSKTKFKRVLLNTAKTAEKFYEKSLVNRKYKKIEAIILKVLKKKLAIYKKIRVITGEEKSRLEEVIDKLINR